MAGRRFARFRKRSRRPVDWVTSFAGYNLREPPVVTPRNSTPDSYVLFANGTDVVNINADDWSYSQPQYDVTVERIKGHLECWLSPATQWWSTLTGRASLKARIEVIDFQVGLAAFPPNAPQQRYTADSFFQPPAGNVEFMWEETFTFIAQSSWGSLTVDPSMYVQRVPVDVRVRRRIDKGSALVLTIGYIGINYAGSEVAFPDAYVDWELRTLVAQRR